MEIPSGYQFFLWKMMITMWLNGSNFGFYGDLYNEISWDEIENDKTLVNCHITMENHHVLIPLMGKSTISTAIFQLANCEFTSRG